MARIVKHLTDTEIIKTKYTSKEEYNKLLQKFKKLVLEGKAKEKDKPLLKNKLSDGGGLFLVIKSNGTKYWQYDFSFGEKRKSMSFGTYPEISLKEARKKREEAKNNIHYNINPINQKKQDKENQKLIFKSLSVSWFDSVLLVEPQTRKNYKDIFNKHVYPLIGKIEIHNIKRKNIVDVLLSVKKYPSNASRIYNLFSRKFSYFVITYDLEYNPIDFKLSDLIKNPKTKHHKTLIVEEDIKKIIIDIKNLSVNDRDYLHYSGVYALKLMPFMFVRISALLQSKWEYIDFEQETWYFPKELMKTDEPFLFPIPKQVVELLVELKEKTYIKSEYIFHSAHNNPYKHLSRGTPLSYLKKILDYDGKMTLHGFRSTFSTTANRLKTEHRYGVDIIEACLSHGETNKVKKAYDRDYLDKYIDEKRGLIQWYADWLDGLQNESPKAIR